MTPTQREILMHSFRLALDQMEHSFRLALDQMDQTQLDQAGVFEGADLRQFVMDIRVAFSNGQELVCRPAGFFGSSGRSVVEESLVVRISRFDRDVELDEIP